MKYSKVGIMSFIIGIYYAFPMAVVALRWMDPSNEALHQLEVWNGDHWLGISLAIPLLLTGVILGTVGLSMKETKRTFALWVTILSAASLVLPILLTIIMAGWV